jgi:hypothetical protein
VHAVCRDPCWSVLYSPHMSQLLDQVVERLRELPQTNQDLAAVELMNFVKQFDMPQIQLSDQQLAELDRRLAEKNPKTLTMAELDARLKRRGI